MTEHDPSGIRYSIDELRKEQQARAREHYKNQHEIIRALRQLQGWLVALFVLIVTLVIVRYWR